ncbi:hypothetical protein H5410_056694 [Solanum commersonii]|uniref:Pentatricopeptide repeat-containing protein n=1 Tax=Solanum commersonii TaxID=4109 RepID=A0A9J5WNG0_SOLCO|nr:hypothetical protein H5410_056694 [Solanum commersonii]
MIREAQEMFKLNVKPNDVTLASILPSWNQLGSISIGKQLHCFAIHNLFENNAYVESSIMSLGYGFHGMDRKALSLLYLLWQNGLEPDGELDGWMKIIILLNSWLLRLLELERSDGISGYHILLSNIYAEEGNWQYVDYVKRGMCKMGLSKEVGHSLIDTSGYPHYFVSNKDKKHPQCCMIYDMLGYLTINMKVAGYKAKLELIKEWIYGLEE